MEMVDRFNFQDIRDNIFYARTISAITDLQYHVTTSCTRANYFMKYKSNRHTNTKLTEAFLTAMTRFTAWTKIKRVVDLPNYSHQLIFAR